MFTVAMGTNPLSHVTSEGTCDVSLSQPLPWSLEVVTVTKDNLHEDVVHVMLCIRRYRVRGEMSGVS